MEATSVDTPVSATAHEQSLADGIVEKPAVNGDFGAPTHEQTPQNAFAPSNASAFAENSSLPAIATATPLKPQIDPHISEPSPVQTSPSDDASNQPHNMTEAQPVVPVQHSQPTPPPDQPYTATAHDDKEVIEEAQATEVPAVSAVPLEPVLSSSVDAPANAADSLQPAVSSPVVEEQAAVAVPSEPVVSSVADEQITTAVTPESAVPSAVDTLSMPAKAETSPDSAFDAPSPPMVDPSPDVQLPAESHAASSLVRPREEDTEEVEPYAKRSRVDEDVPEPEAPPMIEADPVPATSTDVPMPDAPVSSIETVAPPVATPAPTPAPAPSASITPHYHTTPMTDLQKTYLVEKTKNLKKTKHAAPFLLPVDAVKLGIPNYPNVVKNPMDLGTLENKLKADQYNSAQEYADDFNLIVSNSRLFNGDTHVVTIAAINMEAYFKKYMSTLPGPQDTAQPKPPKRASPVAPRPQPRREARQPQQPPAPVSPAAATGAAAQTFALQADGTPQIRRDSTTKRPHRTIKPPQNRELSYAKPKRKEHQLELKFCEHVLEEIRSPKYGRLNHIFQTPVDPVALNIPHYRQVIKNPMDLATMGQKLKNGQYATAQEFRADFELMVNNCLTFNPPGNPVRDIGVELRREFNALWDEKQKWERANKKASERASSDSDESEEESEEEEEDPAQAAAQATIAALTKQLAELQKTVATQWGDGKKKKVKDGKKKEKKNSLGAVSAKSKPAAKAKAPKKLKPLSYDDKSEISNAVGNMNEAQVAKLTQLITDNCAKYRDMGDDMELEIDDLPVDVQHLLLKHVRSIFGNPNRNNRVASPDDLAAEDDDDYMLPARERAAGGGNKRKKHKPMGKKEQQENIAELRKSLAAFNNPASDSGSPTSASYPAQGLPANDTSGDEESEESEEE